MAPNNTKRQKVAADELICPITLELPFDPVVAEDGRVYERSAIEQYMAQTNKSSTSRQALRSPMTNEPMGPRLVATLQIKNLIATLIENRSITGDLVDAWKRKEEKKKGADRLLTAAQNGDANAMYGLYILHLCPRIDHGVRHDIAEALKWLKRASRSGNIHAMAVWGYSLCRGHFGTIRTEKNTSQGLVFMTEAATNGSPIGAYFLGRAYTYGKFGLALDTTQAIAWFRKALSNDGIIATLADAEPEKANSLKVSLLPDSERKEAQEFLQYLGLEK